MWDAIITSLLGPRVLAGDSYGLVHAPLISGWAMALIPDVTTRPYPTTQDFPLLTPPNQTSQEVTHPDTTLHKYA
ncbi:hypothetical protein SLA2020_266180 [Shorea laevis]